MKKKTAVVTGGTSNDVPAMACLVMNIKDTNPNLADEIVILHDGISEKDQKLINSIFPTRFILYESPFEKVEGFKEVITKYFSLMVFCRYECFRLLEDYEMVIWTDYDVVILKDLSELLHKTSNSLKLIPAPPASVGSCFTEIPPNADKYDFNKTSIALPIFVLDDSLVDYKKYYNWIIENTIRYAEYLVLADPAIVNLLIQEFNIEFTPLDRNTYVLHPINELPCIENKILHAFGLPKFWNGLHNKTWEKNYTQWIKMGGTPYEYRTLKYKLKTIKQNFKSKVKKVIKN